MIKLFFLSFLCERTPNKETMTCTDFLNSSSPGMMFSKPEGLESKD